MPSQKSRTAAAALQPKRRRGRERVAAILDAAEAVFAQKGYDAATMTEIASRADTAIGSLYRFFPTKEVVAEALLSHYGDMILAALDEVGAPGARRSPAGLADALVDLVLGWQSHRAAALVLLEARTDAADKRLQLRRAIRRRIAAMLIRFNPDLTPARAETVATVLLHVLKIMKEPVERRSDVVAEARALARLYLTTILA